MKILVRADGGFERGMGHISKQITLSDRFIEDNHEILFVVNKNSAVKRVLEQQVFPRMTIEGDSLSNIDRIIENFEPELIVLDILNTTSEYVRWLKKHAVKIVTFDNTDVSAFDCDVIFNIMYYHDAKVKALYKHKSLYEGYEYIIVRKEYFNISPLKRNKVNRILLTQGGSDTTNQTPVLMRCLHSLKNHTGIFIDVDVVIGPAFSRDNIAMIAEIVEQEEIFHLHCSPDGLADLVECCDVVITAGGTTMWEMAAAERPMYVYINEAFEDETARVVKSLGFALYDGYLPSIETVKDALTGLITEQSLRESIVQNMQKYDIARGIERVVNKMYEHGVLE